MGVDQLCYYLVPAGIGAFGLFMTLFLRRSMKHEPGRIERELKKLTINTKANS
ncbi:MAG: hypothetical protein ACT4N1_00860 [Nitrososphaerota archaeon]